MIKLRFRSKSALFCQTIKFSHQLDSILRLARVNSCQMKSNMAAETVSCVTSNCIGDLRVSLNSSKLVTNLVDFNNQLKTPTI